MGLLQKRRGARNSPGTVPENQETASTGSRMPASEVTPEVPASAAGTSAGYDTCMLQALMDMLSDPVYFKDRNSRFILINRALARGVYSISSPEKAIGRTDFDFFPLEQARLFFQDEQKILATGEPLMQHEERETLPDGREVWFLTSKYPLIKDGKVVGTWGFSRDIKTLRRTEEELKASEAKLRQAEKMEAFGQLAGGVAHDFNNMLQVIMGAAQLLDQKLMVGNTDVKRHIDMLIDTSKRAADLTP